MENKIKPRRCKICQIVFTPARQLQGVCGYDCAKAYTIRIKENKARQEKKTLKEKLKTHKDHLQELQKIFNTYIRERDKFKGCVSCGKSLTTKFDAGHFYSVGKYPNLRFNVYNVHGQCVECNQHRHGNINEYALRLGDRIGNDNLLNLNDSRNEVTKLSVPEIEVLKIKYRELTKILKNEQ